MVVSALTVMAWALPAVLTAEKAAGIADGKILHLGFIMSPVSISKQDELIAGGRHDV